MEKQEHGSPIGFLPGMKFPSYEFTDNKDLIEIMKKSVDDFAGDEPQFDDTTMLSFEYIKL